MNTLDQAIESVKKVYQTVTGTEAPKHDKPYAPIPTEKDPVTHVEGQLRSLLNMVGNEGIPLKPASMIPAMSVWESKKEILLRVDLPGVSRDRLEISQTEHAITLSATPATPARNGHQPRLVERPHANFQRTIALPEHANLQGIQAKMENGLLEIRIPIREIAKDRTPEKITVQ